VYIYIYIVVLFTGSSCINITIFNSLLIANSPPSIRISSSSYIFAGFQVKNRGCQRRNSEEKEGGEAAWGHHQHPQAMVAATRQVAIPHCEYTVPITHACKNATSHLLPYCHVARPSFAVLHPSCCGCATKEKCWHETASFLSQYSTSINHGSS
jgi:hypothetical protein